MNVLGAPLNSAHFHLRNASRLLTARRYTEAITSFENAIDALHTTKESTEAHPVIQASLESQIQKYQSQIELIQTNMLFEEKLERLHQAALEHASEHNNADDVQSYGMQAPTVMHDSGNFPGAVDNYPSNSNMELDVPYDSMLPLAQVPYDNYQPSFNIANSHTLPKNHDAIAEELIAQNIAKSQTITYLMMQLQHKEEKFKAQKQMYDDIKVAYDALQLQVSVNAPHHYPESHLMASEDTAENIPCPNQELTDIACSMPLQSQPSNTSDSALDLPKLTNPVYVPINISDSSTEDI